MTRQPKYEQVNNRPPLWLSAAEYVLFMLFACAAARYLLVRGTIHYRPASQRALGILAVLPFALRPRWRAGTPELLVHDAMVLLSASSFGLLLTEYVVKGGIVIGSTQIWQGFVMHALIFYIVYAVSADIRLTACIGMAVTMLYALVDHYVMIFRGMPVLLSDILDLGTAVNVAANYSAPVERSVLNTLGFALLFCLAVLLTRRRRAARRWQFLWASLLLGCWLCGQQFVGNSFDFWQGNRPYSELYYFYRTAKNAVVKKPEGYSAKSAAQAAAAYSGREGTQRPNIIMIMNESFADLQSVGALETNEDCMPFVHSLMDGGENTVSGSLFVSTFGGGTAKSEFEALTGDTMAFLPFSTSPYQMYVKGEMPGLVRGLDKQGYLTVGMHPYLASSWNRQEVYVNFGFQQTLFEPDFPEDVDRVRDYVSDWGSYEKIIELYENKPADTPLFVFDVTMQNHGGYEDGEYDNFERRIWLTGGNEGRYPGVDNYLSLIRYSDEAIERLVAYFSEADEPTAIVFFGDHQPNVDAALYDQLIGRPEGERSLEERQKKMTTPFFIWANYDIEEQTDVMLSANYLSAYALDALDCSLSPYDQMRLELAQQIPCINSYGYCFAGGEWKSVSDAAEEPVLADYRLLQYAHLFDRENRADEWYDP